MNMDDMRRTCESYGIEFYELNGRFWARHNVAGVTGSFATMGEAVTDAYYRWVETK